MVLPVITTSSTLKLLGAKRVSDVFDGVTQAVGVVIRRVDAPLVPSPVVGRIFDPVGDRVLLALLQSDLHP